MTEAVFGGFWRRVVVAVIDQIILQIIYLSLFLLGSVVGLTGFSIYTYALQPEVLMPTIGGLVLLYYIFCAIINACYFTLFHGYGGQTPGKMIMDLQVIQASGDAMTPGIAFLRWAGYFVSLLFFGLGYLWVIVDTRRQGWHDKIAGTVVIRKKEKYLDKALDID